MPFDGGVEWPSTRLGDIARCFAGGTPSRTRPDYYGAGVPWLKSGEVRAGRIGHTEETITPLALRESAARMAKAGTPVIAMYGATAGISGILDIDAALNQAVLAVEPRLDVLDSEFTYCLLQACAARLLNLVQGSGQPNLSKSLVEGVQVSLPPLDEQRRIAKVLCSVDEAILANSKAYNQAARVDSDLLRTLLDFDNRVLDGKVVERKLSELVSDPITYGVVQPGGYFPEGIPLVRGGDFPKGRIRTDLVPRISSDVTRAYQRSELRGGEIVVSLVGYPGACAKVPLSLAGGNISRSAALIRVGKEVDADFLYWFLRSPIGQARVLKSSVGSAQQVVNLKDLKEVMVPLPAIELQRRLSSILSEAGECEQRRLSSLLALKVLKARVSLDLLSGRVRVPE